MTPTIATPPCPTCGTPVVPTAASTTPDYGICPKCDGRLIPLATHDPEDKQIQDWIDRRPAATHVDGRRGDKARFRIEGQTGLFVTRDRYPWRTAREAYRLRYGSLCAVVRRYRSIDAGGVAFFVRVAE